MYSLDRSLLVFSKKGVSCSETAHRADVLTVTIFLRLDRLGFSLLVVPFMEVRDDFHKSGSCCHWKLLYLHGCLLLPHSGGSLFAPIVKFTPSHGNTWKISRVLYGARFFLSVRCGSVRVTAPHRTVRFVKEENRTEPHRRISNITEPHRRVPDNI